MNIRFLPIPLLCLTTILLLTACPDTPPTHHRDSTIHLSVVSEGTFSVRLNVSVEDSSDTWTFRLDRDDSTVAVISSLRADTTVRDGGLLPGHTYRYRAYWLDGGEATDSSEEVFATTMDTTSHNFMWEIDTLGDYGSYLNDVAIVDENNIWVVGNIETDSGRYNAGHWDGDTWQMILINAPGVIGEGIYYFSEDDIWVTTSIIYHWNGMEWERYHLWDMGVLGPNDGGVKHIWGSSPDDIYFVGDNGSIVHYDGSTFRRMDSGTEVDLTDVWGKYNSATGQYDLWASGNTRDLSRGIILRNQNSVWNTVIETNYLETLVEPPEDTLYADISGIWDGGADSLWITGSWGVFKMSKATTRFRWVYRRRWDYPGPWEAGFPYAIRGGSENDVFMSGQTGTLLHYNGRTWHLYQELYQPYLWLRSIGVTDHEVVVVGTTPSIRAIIIRGRR